MLLRFFNNQHFNWRSARNKFQSQLVCESLLEIFCAAIIPFEVNVEISSEASLVNHRNAKLIFSETDN